MADALRDRLSERLRSPAPYPDDRFEGRGIVICAGGPRYFVCAWVLIWLLRRVYRVLLPIQVWHLGRNEMSEEMRVLLEALQVEVVDAETVMASYPARIAGGWPLKPYAIQHCRFREVLYLDADTVPLLDPEVVFDWEAYRSSGLLMWPDIIDLKTTNPVWQQLGLQPRDCTSVEAGVLAVDKQRAWDVLDVAVLLNEHVEDIYQTVYGDKDTFLLSCLLKGRTPQLIAQRPFILDADLVQRDPDGDPFLQHRTGSKWNLLGNNRPAPTADLTARCDEALAALRERWSGEVFNPPQRSGPALAEEQRLLATRHFHYEPQGSDSRLLEFLSAGRVGNGRGDFERHWAVIERDGVLVLQFYSATRLTIELTRASDDSWEGRCIAPAGFLVRLVDQSARRTWPHVEGRVSKSAAEWITSFVDPSLFAAGFSTERASQLFAALSLLNERFDDVAEQLDARLAALAVPEQWRSALKNASAELAASRDQRLALATRATYPQVIDPKCYDRVT